MNDVLEAQLIRLSAAEKLELIGKLWDSIAPEDHPPLTEAQMAELDRRQAEHERDPSSALSWEDVKAKLDARFSK